MDGHQALERTIRAQQTKYYGKYRAFIYDNKDPEQRGRCKLIIPSVLGETVTDWALPAFAYGGGADFGWIAVPPNEAQVIAEFMEGDVSAPLWTGAFWRKTDEVPEAYKANTEPSAKVLRTESGHVLVFEDKDGEEVITLTSKAEAQMKLDEKGSFQLTDAKGATLYLDADKGEVTIEDSHGNSMVMSSSGIACKDANGNEIKTEGSSITVKGSTITIEGSSVAVGGAGGDPIIKGNSFMALFNTHMHTCTAPGSPSSPPMKPMTPAELTTKSTAS